MSVNYFHPSSSSSSSSPFIDCFFTVVYTALSFVFGVVLTDTIQHVYDSDSSSSAVASSSSSASACSSSLSIDKPSETGAGGGVTKQCNFITFYTSIAVICLSAYQQSVTPIVFLSCVYYVVYAIIAAEQALIAGRSIFGVDFLREPLVFCGIHAAFLILWHQLDYLDSFSIF